MGKTTVKPEDLQDAVRKALEELFPDSHRTTAGARQEFYDKFQREASDHDDDFTEKYDSDLDTTLIFAGLFSAVTSAFIVFLQPNLQQDYAQLSYGLLQVIANNTNSSLGGHATTGSAATPPPWPGPGSDAIRVQATLYASLAATLLAAFVAMMGKQWLKRYSQTEMRGSVVDRCRYRQRKMDGMDAWHFDLVMECLPLLLQAGILLLGYALSDYLFSIDKVVAGVTIGFTASGALFYLLIVLAAFIFYNCPFQTPFSRYFRWVFRLDNERKKKSGPNDKNLSDHVELPMAYGPPPAPLFEREADLGEYVLDSKCIARMFQMSIDADVSMAIMKFIPEIVWYAGIRTTPLEKLYDTVLECFDQSSGHPVVIPKFKEKAYLSAKALAHLAIQRKCIGNEPDEAVFKSISERHQTMGSKHYEQDPDLESTLDIIDRVFSAPEPIQPEPVQPEPVQPEPKQPKPVQWESPSFNDEHRAWMGHILLYRAWDAIGKHQPLPDDTKEFVLHSLRLVPPPPARIIADCLFIVGLVLGIQLCVDDLLVVDKSGKVNHQINMIFTKLTETFTDPTNADEIDRALEVMKLIAPLSKNGIAQKSYDLFRVVMQTPVSTTYSQEKKWDASRLTMHGANKQDEPFQLVKDPRDILTFLGHHFDLATGDGENQDEPIQDALCVLAYASDPTTIKALKDFFDSQKQSFVHGICHAYQDSKPPELRRAVFFFHPLIVDRFFDTRSSVGSTGGVAVNLLIFCHVVPQFNSRILHFFVTVLLK